MAKYHGRVGYSVEVEKYPGVGEPVVTEHEYYGDIIKNRLNLQQGSNVNPTLTLGHNISIIADAYAYENFYAIRYVTYLNKKWLVTGIEIERPRIILTIGGLYK